VTLLEGCPIVSTRSLIPQHALLACAPLGGKLDAQQAGEAIARGLLAGGRAEPDLCTLPARSAEPAALLERLHFDRRMRASRAVVIVVAQLQPRTLPGSLAFEIATRARQSGVPCYAVSTRNGLDSFDERMLDLQLVLLAGTPAQLRRAGERLADVI
jgi:glycerate 2-kinase